MVTMENINVNILTKEFVISCPTDLKAELNHAVDYLNRKIAETSSIGKIKTFEKILLNVALNLAHEIVQKNTNHVNDTNVLTANLTLLNNKLDKALTKSLPSNKLNLEYNK